MVRSFEARATGCKPGPISVSRFEVAAGLVRLVRNKKGRTQDFGIPGAILVSILPGNATGTNYAAPSGCTFSTNGRAAAGTARAFAAGSVKIPAKCVSNLGLKCGAPYRVRAQAKGRGRLLLPSDWSADFGWRPVCEGDAGKSCFV